MWSQYINCSNKEKNLFKIEVYKNTKKETKSDICSDKCNQQLLKRSSTLDNLKENFKAFEFQVSQALHFKHMKKKSADTNNIYVTISNTIKNIFMAQVD